MAFGGPGPGPKKLDGPDFVSTLFVESEGVWASPSGDLPVRSDDQARKRPPVTGILPDEREFRAAQASRTNSHISTCVSRLFTLTIAQRFSICLAKSSNSNRRVFCNVEIRQSVVSFLGSARALACRLRRPRRNGLAQGQEMYLSQPKLALKKFAMTRASSPARHGTSPSNRRTRGARALPRLRLFFRLRRMFVRGDPTFARRL